MQTDGAILRISDKNEGESWETAEIARVPDAAQNLAGEIRLNIADLDNNGALDLILSQTSGGGGALIWLGDEKGAFTPLSSPVGSASVFAAADFRGNGHLDLLGLTADGQPIQAMNQSSKNYHWQVVRPHAVQAVGDQRINPFGVGGEIEVRSGLLVQKQPITGPQLHFGLGERTEAEVVRVVWPNGTVRAEFDVKADQDVVTEQRLKASCPFLFAYNGKEMEFVKDAVPWGSAIGLRINTLGSAQIAATGEWYKIGRDQLVPHDGYYDIRVTAELWEVYYYDYLALTAIDHPAGTEIFVDERFVIPPAKLGITTVSTPHDIAHAMDDTGQDVTELLRKLDGKAVSSFGRGQFQGVTRDHYLELDLGDDAPKSGPLYLIAQGSIHDTESSVNVAITQGNRWRAHGLSVQVPDGHGGWVDRAGQSRFSCRPQEDYSFQSHEYLPSRNAAARAPAHESGNILGRNPLGGRSTRHAAQRGNFGSDGGRLALSRLLSDAHASGSGSSGSSRLQRHRRDQAALARFDRLLHALRRRPRTAEDY